MNNDQAKRLIEQTFNTPFNENRFRNFIDDMLIDVDFDESISRISSSKNQFSNHIKEFSKLGRYTDPSGESIDILSVSLYQAHSLERSRTLLRNFVADYLRDSIDVDTCLVAFSVDSHVDWRFSFIKASVRITS